VLNSLIINTTAKANDTTDILLLLCTEDDNSCYRNVCKMSVVSFALAVVFIIFCCLKTNDYRKVLTEFFIEFTQIHVIYFLQV